MDFFFLPHTSLGMQSSWEKIREGLSTGEELGIVYPGGGGGLGCVEKGIFGLSERC